MAATAVLVHQRENHFQKLQVKSNGEYPRSAVIGSKQIETCFKVICTFNKNCANFAKVVTEINGKIAENQGNIVKGLAKTEKTTLSQAPQASLTASDVKADKAALAQIASKKAPAGPLAHSSSFANNGATKQNISAAIQALTSDGAREIAAKYDLNTAIQRKVLLRDLEKLAANTDETGAPLPGARNLPRTGDIFLRFITLLGRMYGQTQLDANDLYQKVKERTDQIELMSELVTTLNLMKGPVDWSNDAAMKQKLDYAIDHCGLKWEKGNYKFETDETRALFRENVSAKKETFERISKLDQTKMQRYMHESTELLGLRSNVAKMRHDLMQAIISNFRAH